MILLTASAGQPADDTAAEGQTPALEEPIAPIPSPPAADPARLALGEALFADRRLSRSNSIACVSCHDVATNGASRPSPKTAPGGSSIRFNIPTVFNAALSFRLNWEGNIRTLEEQAEATLESPATMNSTADEAVRKLNADPQMVSRFVTAYGHRPDRGAMLDAIATYERSLLTPDSRFDRWLKGDSAALSGQERTGYELFKSLGCISCHQGVNVGANLFERHGIFHPLAAPLPEILRVPSLRNVAVTPPYFHDGSAATLDDAVRKMAASQLDETLTEAQVDAIVAFLGTLTGRYRGNLLTQARP
ncbi:MAG TPA: cytochrome c peroxidase [Rhodopila sp.]|nr:cytochrome c peroxidase [Rhodopila sp.]